MMKWARFPGVCLVSITIACSRLRRSPVLVCCVKNARSAFFTQHTPLFARRSRANIRRERAKTLRIRHALGVIVALTLVLSGCTLTVSPNPPSSTSSSNNPSAREPNWGVQTKTSGCMAHNGLQDFACTPGAIFTNATKDVICQQGYARTVRNVPQSEKNQVYAEYGITSHLPGQYEVDHLVRGFCCILAMVSPPRSPVEPLAGRHPRQAWQTGWPMESLRKYQCRAGGIHRYILRDASISPVAPK